METLGITDALPDMATQQHLLDLYFTYVHPHFPIVSFPFRSLRRNSESETSRPTSFTRSRF